MITSIDQARVVQRRRQARGLAGVAKAVRRFLARCGLSAAFLWHE